jgi:hypothetical protein
MALAEPRLDLRCADEIAVGVVVAAKSEDRSGIFYTKLEVAVSACHQGACAQTLTISVPGGKVGDFEQFIIDHPVPQLGEAVAVTRIAGRHFAYRLADPEVAKALRQLPGSPAPQAVGGAPSNEPQPAVKTQ